MFLPFVLTLYYITPRRFRNLTLFIVDLVFYAWGEPWLVILMLFSILLNYTSGILIGINREKKGLARFIFILSVILNLGLLGFFKYAGFIGETLNMVMPFLNIPILEIALPIGISFYTFQTMSYTIDVYKNTVKVQKNIITFGTYVSLFPQLIAGPIVRYEDVAEQLMHRKETLQGFTDGVKLFLIGLSKKVLLANEMGNLWDAVRESGTQSGALGSWVGIIAYTFQIYFDFCGYSEMAMGLGKMFGFDFLKNFDYPYISKNITEFWRRWHISLGTWFREYVYIPLGGSRCGVLRRSFNILTVWLLTGLWHGASMNFVLWGLYFALLLVLEKAFLLRILEKLPRAAGHLYTMLAVIISWAIFALDTDAIIPYLKTMLGIGAPAIYDLDALYMLSGNALFFAVLAVGSTGMVSALYRKFFSGMGTEYGGKERAALKMIVENVCLAALLIISLAYVEASTYNPFLYFRF